MGKLDGKVAIITGSSAGIGKTTAALFAQEGASVTIHGRSSESIKKTFELLKSNGVPENKILTVQGQIENEQTCHDLINKTVQKFGKLDILVNNAGIGAKTGVDPFPMENFNYIFDVNLKSVVLMTQLAIPHLEKTNGNIVNVSSIGALRASAIFPFYSMAKAALDHFGRCYSLILADKGIRINTLNPGGIDTEFAFKIGFNEDQYNKFVDAFSASCVPMKRYGFPDEMAKTILFMATDATYMTGANIVADGGAVNFSPMPKLD